MEKNNVDLLWVTCCKTIPDEGLVVGAAEGTTVGEDEGPTDGVAVGLDDGRTLGEADGRTEGTLLGLADGFVVGTVGREKGA